MDYLDPHKGLTGCLIVVWWALQSKKIPDAYIDLIRNMYHHTASVVQTDVGDSNSFQISILWIHQESGFDLFLYNVVMDTVSAHIQDDLSRLMIFADSIGFIDENRLMLEPKVNL